VQRFSIRSAGRLHGHPAHDGDDEVSERCRVGPISEIALRNGALKPDLNLVLQTSAAAADFLSYRATLVGADERPMHHQTTRRVRGIRVEFRRPA
jgi:hypothetical protein